MKAPRLKAMLLSILGLALIAALAYYLYINTATYSALLRLSPLPVVLILALTVVSLVINGGISARLYNALGARLLFRDGLLLSSAASLANQLPTTGGVIARGLYLKRKHDMSYPKFASATLALLVCFIAANGLVGILILAYWTVFERQHLPIALLAGFGAMLSSFLVFLLPVGRIRLPFIVRTWLNQALEGWRLVGRNPAVLWQILALQGALVLILAVRYWLAFQMLSQEVTLSETLLFAAASVLTQLASFAPGGLGVTEAIVGGVALTLGFDLKLSVAAVALDRVISTVIIVVGGGISAVIIGRQWSARPGDSVEQDRELR